MAQEAPPTTPYRIPTWTLGDRLRKARITAGISVGEMAAHLGVSPDTVTNYERENTTPRRAVLMAYAEKCNVPLGWIEDDNYQAEVVELAGRAERRAVAAPTHAKKAASEGRRRRAVNRRQGQEPLTDPGTDFRWSSAPRPALVVLPSAS